MRIVHEASLYKTNNTFLTLTYNDKNLPKGNTLIKNDVQQFMKNLRQKIKKMVGNDKKDKIRFYACGEYGEITKRAHYHIILFNYWPSDTKYLKKRPEGSLFKSELMDKIWNKGNCAHAEVNFETAAYVARYVCKKITGDISEEHYNGRLPEFALMSRRPGIGKPWLEKFNEDTWKSDSIVMRGIEMKPPTYYSKLLELTDKSKHDTIKWKRKAKAKLNAETDDLRLNTMDIVEQKKRKFFLKESI